MTGSEGTGFTLIEMLTVIAIIGLLAAFVMPITRAVSVSKVRNRARTELTNIETAIEAYKAKLGFYPPADPGQPTTNTLYFELLGTKMDNAATIYTTLDGSSSIAANAVSSTFGSQVGGFLNCTRPGGGDDTPAATAFLGGLKPAQYFEIVPGAPGVKILIGPSAPGNQAMNPWGYNSSNPAFNPKTFDLWIDIIIAGKTNRISNWTDQVLIVSHPYPLQ